MPLYESTFIARQDISTQQAEALAERFSGIVTEQGGKVHRTEHWGLKSLSFRIRKNRKGHYVMLHIEAPAAAVQEMERNMRIDEDVLRYMTVRMETMPDAPSAMLQSRASRDDRGRRDGPRGDRFDRGDRPRRSERPAEEVVS
ncbi:MAG: 30S ribosomal protein S6 [Alphaproteobacteria bacterium]|nr:30S ribosomal protein S6 [Alphaproteobacteria bacterium]